MNILNLLKQRRIWAAISAIIASVLVLIGYNGEFNPDELTNLIMAIVNAIAGLAAIVLPIISYLKPKK